jgi:hypothetical protein
MIDLAGPDYGLRWPPDLFLSEAGRVLNLGNANAAEILIRDAFRNGAEVVEGHGSAIHAVEAVLDHAAVLRVETERTPYWSERTKGTGGGRERLDVSGVARRVVAIVQDLYSRGYFDRDLPFDCVDVPDRYRDPGDYIEEHTGRTGFWPLRDSTLAADVDALFDVIEVFHDVAARPVDGSYHSWNECGWHYSVFNGELGRRIYRWAINRILDQSTLSYRLAEDGEDIGRLVAVADEAREDLVMSMLHRSGPSQDRVQHAISLFRMRGSTRDDKRSAVRSLADVLEDRRADLRASLMTKDEAVLFQLANQFDIRHHNASQRSDYDPAFLDWVFWWYLATIELMDRLIAGQTEDSGGGEPRTFYHGRSDR